MTITNIRPGERIKLHSRGVSLADLANISIATSNLADGSVTSGKLATGAVTGSKIAAETIEAGNLGPGSVSTSKLDDEGVTTEKLANASVTEAKLGNSQVTENKIGTGAVTANKIGALAVITAKIDDAAVTEAKIGNSQVTANKIGTGAVTTNKIDAGAVTAAKIAIGAVEGISLDYFENAPEKVTTLDDSDAFNLRDTDIAGLLGRISWLNIKASIWAGLGVLIANGVSKATPVDGDALALFDSASATFSKKLTWANLKQTALTSPILRGILQFRDTAEIDQLGIDPRPQGLEFQVRHANGGEIFFGWDHGRFVHPLQPLDKHGRNIAYAQGVSNKSVTHLAYPFVGISSIVEYGQSKAYGAETWPPKSTTNIDGNTMLGNDVRSSDDDSFVPYGSNVFTPLVALIMGGGGVPLTGGEIAALAPGSANAGEPPGIGATNLFKLLMNRRARVASDATRLLNYYNCSAGGYSMDVLRKGHTIGSVEVYGRYLDFLTDFSSAAAAAGLPRQVLAILWGQGENEMLQSGCSSTNRAEFRALLQIMINDMQADALATGGNSRVPGFFSFVGGENYTQDLDGNEDADLFVHMAFLEHMWAGTKSFFLIGPHYPYTDKEMQHFDANGSRWAGLKAGLVMDRVINQCVAWEPLAPIETEYHGGTELWIHFNVPVPPLRTGLSYRNGLAMDFTDRGFKVTDAKGTITISQVDVFPTMVRLHLSHVLLPGALVWYADKGDTHFGHGNIRDSESADPLFVYEYAPGSGDYTSANIPALVDEPYDMSNWLCPFCLPVNWSRF